MLQTMIEVIALEDGVDTSEDTIDVEGMPLYPVQVERLSAWANEIEPTANALCLEPEPFLRRVLESLHQASEKAPSSNLAVARRLLGADSLQFENRPALGTSGKAGLAGRLAALNFEKD